MALCDYSIHIKGNKQAALMFCAIIKRLGDLCINKEFENGQDYVIWISGQCSDEHDLYGKESAITSIDHNMLTEEQVREGACLEDFFDLSLRQKSELLGLEILVRSWSKENDYDQLEHYKKGYFVGIIGSSYNDGNNFEFDF